MRCRMPATGTDGRSGRRSKPEERVPGTVSSGWPSGAGGWTSSMDLERRERRSARWPRSRRRPSRRRHPTPGRSRARCTAAAGTSPLRARPARPPPHRGRPPRRRPGPVRRTRRHAQVPQLEDRFCHRVEAPTFRYRARWWCRCPCACLGRRPGHHLTVSRVVRPGERPTTPGLRRSEFQRNFRNEFPTRLSERMALLVSEICLERDSLRSWESWTLVA